MLDIQYFFIKYEGDAAHFTYSSLITFFISLFIYLTNANVITETNTPKNPAPRR
jgi:hypothetical protein